MKALSSVIGFFEILIWLFAIGQIMNNLTNIYNYIAYAIGFSLGIFIGIVIEEKLSLGVVMLRIITKKDAAKLVHYLKSTGFGVTTMNAKGLYGTVDVIFTIVERKELENIREIIKKFNPKAVYSVEDIKYVSQKPFPIEHVSKKGVFRLFWVFRKSK